MNISHTEVINNESTLNLVITKEDINPKVEQTLKQYRKQVNIKGFRKGQAPESLIRKQYELEIKAQEINKLIQESVSNYITENKLSLFNSPVPISNQGNLETDETLTFSFLLGFNPEINLELSTINVPFNKFKVTEKLIEEELNAYKRKFATRNDKNEEAYNENLAINLELDLKIENNDKKYSISVHDLKNKSIFTDKKVNDEINISIDDLLIDDSKENLIINLEQSIKDFNKDVLNEITVKVVEIFEEILPELNEEFFKKVFPSKEINNIEDFKKEIEQNITTYLDETSKNIFNNDVIKVLLDNVKFDLPENYIKEFIKSELQNSNKVAADLLEQTAIEEKNKSIEFLKFQLIENVIVEKFEIKNNYQDIFNHLKNNMIKQYGAFMADLDSSMLDDIITKEINNKENLNKYNEELVKEKVMNILLENVTLEEKTFDGIKEYLTSIKK